MASYRSEQEQRKSILRVLSFNIRQDVESDGENRWQNRRERLVEVLNSWSADIIGLQEPYRHQLDFILESLPEFTAVGVGRDDGRAAGEFCPILYRKDRFAALEGSTFWLSESPDAPGSISWKCRHPRICSWVRLSDRRTYQGFYVYNTHLDNESQEAREKGIALIAERIRGRVGIVPVILMGDFNAPSDEPAIATIRAENSPTPIDALATHAPPSSAGTYHGFTGQPQEPRIDYIFVSPEWRVAECRILAETGPAFSSDHFPVAAVLES